MTILLVDDNALMRKLLKDIIFQSNWQDTKIIEASNGNEAIIKFLKHKPDLVLLDMVMPQKSGIEVLQQIGMKASVVVISAERQEKVIREAKCLGAKAYIIKPFALKQMIKTLNRFLPIQTES